MLFTFCDFTFHFTSSCSFFVNCSYNWFYYLIFNLCVFFVDIFSSAQKQPKLVFFLCFFFVPSLVLGCSVELTGTCIFTKRGIAVYFCT